MQSIQKLKNLVWNIHIGIVDLKIYILSQNIS